MSLNTKPARDLVIAGGNCLLAGEGLTRADIRCSGGAVVEIAPKVSRVDADVIDATGCFALPGIVDIHGDAFERQIMPRPKTMFPLDIAMAETDRQAVANGVTTAYHGITVSWEPGLRSLDEANRIVSVLDAFEATLLADNRIHIRWETFAIDQAADVIKLFTREKKPLLAFNDHTTPSITGVRTETKIRGSAERAMVDTATYDKLLDAVWEHKDEVPQAVGRMSAAAQAHGVPMLSHDDCTENMRQTYRALGVGVAEFPMNWDTAREAATAGDDIVLGAPNIVRGGSHNGAISAEEAIGNGLCTILASDYYYPAPLNAAFALVRRGKLPLDGAWALISESPARACGLRDRGRIAQGLRADLVIVPEDGSRAAATIVAGAVAYRSC